MRKGRKEERRGEEKGKRNAKRRFFKVEQTDESRGDEQVSVNLRQYV